MNQSLTHMEQEMREQPDVLAGLVNRYEKIIDEVQKLVADNVAGVAFLARGSSDHAALLGRYAVEFYSGLPTCLIAPSLTTAYRRKPSGFANWLVVALSQSGQTPEIVNTSRDLAASGARVVGITNDLTSELASVAQLAIGLEAGQEQAVPATKTVTSQMLTTLAVASGFGPVGLDVTDAAALPTAVAQVLSDTVAVEESARLIAGRDRLAVVGRGFVYPAALELALKLQETTGIMAHGFSTADFRHGPIAVCGSAAPAVLLAGSGPADNDTRSLSEPLVARDTELITIGTGLDDKILMPPLGTATECIVGTVRGQQLALYTAQALGIDPDAPAGLNKVTMTD